MGVRCVAGNFLVIAMRSTSSDAPRAECLWPVITRGCNEYLTGSGDTPVSKTFRDSKRMAGVKGDSSGTGERAGPRQHERDCKSTPNLRAVVRCWLRTPDTKVRVCC